MDNIFFDAKRVMDALGDCSPRCRHLVADYKDGTGRDLHQELMTWHSPGAGDGTLVESIKAELAQAGCRLTALAEYLGGGKAAALYIAPGYLDEYAEEMGLVLPEDIAAALASAGVHPVNLEELKHGR